jgi:cell division protein ZapA (FtsZ GTPase activity inhibitor)
MTKQQKSTLQGLLWLSVILMITSTVEILISRGAGNGSIDSVAITLIGVVGLNVHQLLKSLFQKLDRLEKKIDHQESKLDTEIELANQRVDLTVKTPVESDKAQATAGHP